MLEKDFVKIWVGKIKDGMLKNFPNDFLNEIPAGEIELPGKMLILGPELFGAYELTDSKGNPFLQTPDLYKIKYLLYANRLTFLKTLIPLKEEQITGAVKEYEKHIDSLVSLVEKDFKVNFPDSKNVHSVSNQIFGTLNLQRY